MKRQQRGVSLIELLVAVAILLIGVVPLIRVIMYGLEVSNRAHKMTRATNLAREMAEEIRSQAYSEEFVYGDRASGCDNLEIVYPETDTAQCFGLEAGESHTDTASKGGRIAVLDDIDDYNGWCRGRECGGSFLPLEDHDGEQHSNESLWFTRRVRIHNLNVAGRELETFRRDIFPNYTSSEDKSPYSEQTIKRFNFENWSSLTQKEDATGSMVDASGWTWLKRIEVRVTHNGAMVKDLEVVDVSYAVMPRALLQ